MDGHQLASTDRPQDDDSLATPRTLARETPAIADEADLGITDAGVVDEEIDTDPDLPESTPPQRPAFSPTEADVIATVVIVNYNGAHLLRPCLDGLARQTMTPGSFRVVVVDNASADPSRDLLREEYPDVELLVSYRNTGFAGGNNLALHEVDTEFAVLLNNDAVPEPDWLATLLAPLQDPERADLVATSSKIVFLPRFVRLTLDTPPFIPGGLDPRSLGVKVYSIELDGVEIADKVLWERAGFGPEGSHSDQYRWTLPNGEFLVPLPTGEPKAHRLTIGVAGPEPKPVTFALEGTEVTVTAPATRDARATAELDITADTPRYDVINNVGGIVFVDGSGADRGFQEIDSGQYDHAERVFTACGNGVAIRSAAGHRVGWFDDRYFMYYEDVDLSWRLRADGGQIEYVPGAVLRHIHSASSKPFSPRWLFHVERNRLLTLTKDASGGRAAKAVADFVATTAKMTARELVHALRGRRRPHLAQPKVRAKVLGSYVALLPGLLRDRRALGQEAAVSREELEKWLVTSR